MNKEWTADSRITDRFIYNEAISVKSVLLKQEELKTRLWSFDATFRQINAVELIEIDTIEACGLKTDCKIKRTKYKLPEIFETSSGPLIKSVTSLDGSQSVFQIQETGWLRKQGINDRHAKNEIYFWVKNNYLYLPNIEWDYIKVEAAFKNFQEIDKLNNCDGSPATCESAYELSFNIPEYLEKSLKDLLNESLLRYYHRLRFDDQVNKNPNK